MTADDPEDTTSSPQMRRTYLLVVVSQTLVMAALWAASRLFA